MCIICNKIFYFFLEIWVRSNKALIKSVKSTSFVRKWQINVLYVTSVESKYINAINNKCTTFIIYSNPNPKYKI